MHERDTGHKYDLENFKVKDRGKTWHNRVFLEAAHTILESNPCNRSIEINNVYRPIIRKYLNS